MCKVDVYKIVEYEKFKYNFFENREHNNSFLDEEYSSFEESVYGRELCQIYEGLYNINYGKKYLKNILMGMFLSIISLVYNIIYISNTGNCTRLYNTIFFSINVIFIMFLFIKIMMIKKYYNFLLYKYVKFSKNK